MAPSKAAQMGRPYLCSQALDKIVNRVLPRARSGANDRGTPHSGVARRKVGSRTGQVCRRRGSDVMCQYAVCAAKSARTSMPFMLGA